MEHELRRTEHRRSGELEALLQDINAIAQAGAAAGRGPSPRGPAHPVLLVAGCARSGTTLLMQWLAASGQFAYPSNLASRFYGSPRLGALVQRALIELDTRAEFFPSGDKGLAYASVLGKTRGAAQPNEFWYFWRRFFPFGEIQQLDAEVLASVDHARMVRELAEFEAVFDRPLAMKAMILNWHLDYLVRVLPRALLVHVRRDPADTALSLLAAREQFFGDPAVWYSFKPPEHAWLRDLTPAMQVAGQVLATERAIAQGLRQVPGANVFEVPYERLCAAPAQVWHELGTRLVALGFDAGLAPYTGPAGFEPPRRADPRRAEVEAALQSLRPRFEGGHGAAG
jgi:LPS sulfotransferase NodH